MKPVALVAHQIHYEQKAYWRNPASAFFTFVFPLVFLVIFASLNNGATIDFLGGLAYNQFYVPAIIGFGVISATYTQLAISLSLRRQSGELKRFRATPLPSWALIGGLLGNSIVIAVLITGLTAALGIIAYGVVFPGHWLALGIALVVGAATFCALGVMVSTLVPNADAAPAVVNAVFFPVLFLSGTFFPINPNSVIANIADIFPIRHFNQALFSAFDPRLPHGPAHGFAWSDVGVMALWAIGATLIGVRRFRWEPRR